MKVEGSDKLVPAFSDGGCIGLSACPKILFEFYFSDKATSIRATAPALDYQGSVIPVLGEFDIVVEELRGFKTREPNGKRRKKITFTITKTGQSTLIGRLTMVHLGLANEGERLAKEVAEVERHGILHVEKKEVDKKEDTDPPSMICSSK